MSDTLFDAIRKEVHAGGAFVSTSTSIAIDAAEEAYKNMVALSAGSSLCEGCQKKRMDRRIIATPRIQVEEERDALRARVAALESERIELVMSKARREASHAVLMQGLAVYARGDNPEGKPPKYWVEKANEAAMSVRYEDIVTVTLNDARHDTDE